MNLVENKNTFFEEKEKIKLEIAFINKATEQTLLGLNFEKKKPTKKLEQDSPK